MYWYCPKCKTGTEREGFQSETKTGYISMKNTCACGHVMERIIGKKPEPVKAKPVVGQKPKK